MKSETYNNREEYGICGTYDVTNQPPKPGERGSFRFRDMDHTPHNKRHGEVSAAAKLTVTDEPNGTNTDRSTKQSAPVKGWVTVQIDEYVSYPSGKEQHRAVSVTLSHDARKALIAYLTAQGE